MSSYTTTPGLANVDFVIFPPRWLPAEGTFRPPWFHRNCMSEFMGLLTGGSDNVGLSRGAWQGAMTPSRRGPERAPRAFDSRRGRQDSFRPGASSVHNRYVPHGPDAAAVQKGSELDTTQPQRCQRNGHGTLRKER